MNLRELVRRELRRSGEADPKVIARRLIPRLTTEHRAAVLAIGIEYLVRNEAGAHGESVAERTEQSKSLAGPSRRSIVQRERVCVGQTWKLLIDCTVSDLQALAADYRKRSHEMLARAAEAEALAAELQRSGSATVGEMRQRAERKLAA